MSVVLEILAAARVFENKARVLFRPHDLTPAQFNVLNCLSDRPEGMRASDLASDLVVDPSNVTGLLKRMKSAGLLKEVDSPRDRRQHVVSLSPKGRALWNKSRPIYEKSLRSLEAELTSQERVASASALQKLKSKAESL